MDFSKYLSDVWHIHNLSSHFCFVYMFVFMYVVVLVVFIFRITVSAIYLALWLLFTLCMFELHYSVDLNELNDDDKYRSPRFASRCGFGLEPKV